MFRPLIIIVAWLLAGALRFVEKQTTVASLLLERFISRLHSVLYTVLDAISAHISPAFVPEFDSQKRLAQHHFTAAGDSASRHQQHHRAGATATSKSYIDSWQQRKASSRAYWDPSKGSAVVVWSAGGDQTLSQSLALSLAGQRAQKRATRAGQPPYTVIVIVPSSSEGLTELISAWARTKAEATRNRSVSGSGSGSETSGESQDVQDEGKEKQGASAEGSTSRPQARSTGKHAKRRQLSIGGWDAGAIVGYGFDMLKGLRVGKEESVREIGAVIPVVADTSTAAGLAYAQSTIQDYCVSHNLLLRGLIIVPSIMTNKVDQTLRKGTEQQEGPTSRGMASGHARASTPPKSTTAVSQALALMAEETGAALAADVKESIQVIAALHPSLQTDGGRIIGLLPSAWRSNGLLERWLDCGSEFNVDTLCSDLLRAGQSSQSDGQQMAYDVGRKAMIETLEQVDRALHAHGDGVSISRVRMAPMCESSTVEERRLSRTSGKQSLFANAVHGITKIIDTLAHPLLYPAEPSPYARAMTQLYGAAATAGSSPSGEGYGDTQANSPATRIPSTSIFGPPASTTLQISPLLIDAVCSLLARSVPRKHVSIGLGPRFEDVLSCVPGHDTVRHWLTSITN